ncbi:MAG: type II toxin-antitoxin system RelE/ParE family toxin [Rubrobacteraceae bacterium]
MDTGGRQAWKTVYYKSAAGNVPVKEFIETQSVEARGAIFEDLRQLREVNVRLGAPRVRKLEGRDFWELRTRVAGNVYRTFYFAHVGRKFVLLHAFQKKSRRTPVRELDTAEARMRDYLERNRKRRKR